MGARRWAAALAGWALLGGLGVARAEGAQDVDALARALVELREAAGLSVSPSGARIVFEVRRADARANLYRSHWLALDLARPSEPVVIASGGDMPFGRTPRSERPMSVWMSLAPRWSPDETAIAYLRRDGEATQIWRARSDGSGQEKITDAAGDVIDFVWSADGRAIIYDPGPARAALDAARMGEARLGFLLDDRFDPVSSWAPVRTHGEVPDPPCCQAIELNTRAVRAASALEIARYRTLRPSSGYNGAPGMAHMWTVRHQGEAPIIAPFAREPHLVRWRKPFANGAAAVLALANPQLRGGGAPVTLYARERTGARFIACAAPSCSGWIIDAWRLDDGDIVFLRREGWAFSRFAFYRWRASTGAVRQLIATEAIWYDCDLAKIGLVCFSESALAPQTLVALDLDSGAVATLHELNPDFDRAALAPAERLEWRSPLGFPDFGYFVAPRTPRPAAGFPLVIVHYRARGFLRGGTGDFSPVQAYAAAGIAVLVVDRPEDWDLDAREPDEDEIERQSFEALRQRQDIFDALEAGLAPLIARGDVDPGRIGISGLSDGSASTAYAIAHSNRFRAASISGGAWEPILFTMSSPRQRAFYTSLGLGAPGGPADRHWSGLSIARNGERITTPLLIQTADRELAMALEPLVALQTLGKPVEAYVFPDEDHVMWQPAHRLALYRRNLDWFRFWLQDFEAPSPIERDQYARWRAMRASLPH